MLKDLLNEFIHHQDQYSEFDMDTMVLDSYRLKPGLYIRLNRDGGLDECFIGKRAKHLNPILC